MTQHPSDDDLIQYSLGELAEPEHATVAAHVAACGRCEATTEEVLAILRIAGSTVGPDPDPEFEARMWARIAPALGSPRAAWGVRHIVPIAAWAAVVVAIVGASLLAVRTRTAPPAATPERASAVAPESRAPERVLFTALDQHFVQTELLLVELLNAPPVTPGSLEFERATADELVTSGRLYRETAEDIGQRQFAEIIDELEPVLVDVARSSGQHAGHDLASWREQIEDAGLLFKVRAATNEVRVRRDPLASASKGAL
jgi:hypothetical protein